jgi:Glycerophosphoryl diester phosphodiesterase family
MALWHRGRRRWAIAGVLIIVLAVAGALVWPSFQSYTGKAPPAQYYRPVLLDPSLANAYQGVVGIAHNAGNNLSTSEKAQRYDADVIEIDVISARGRLRAGREQPTWPWLARTLFRGPTLAQAWDAVGNGAIKLDLKHDGQTFLEQVVSFVATREKTRRVYISTPDADALRYLHAHLPHVLLLFTVANPDALTELRTDISLQRSAVGVSVFQGLVNAQLIQWLHARSLLAFAWTITDGQQLNSLVRLGVDGITTPNLAILRDLG